MLRVPGRAVYRAFRSDIAAPGVDCPIAIAGKLNEGQLRHQAPGARRHARRVSNARRQAGFKCTQKRLGCSGVQKTPTHGGTPAGDPDEQRTQAEGESTTQAQAGARHTYDYVTRSRHIETLDIDEQELVKHVGELVSARVVRHVQAIETCVGPRNGRITAGEHLQ